MRLALFASLAMLLLTSACVRPLSTAPPASGRNPFTPVPAPRLCAAADLRTSSSAHADANATILGVTLINRSASPCNLQNPPQVSLPGADGPLDVQTVAEGDGQAETLAVLPGESAILVLVWGNYCGPALKDGPVIRVTLEDGESLDVTAEANSVPGCRGKNDPSTLAVHPYSYPP